MAAWMLIISVVLVAGAGPSTNSGSTAINIVNKTHSSNLSLPDVLNNTSTAVNIVNKTHSSKLSLPDVLNNTSTAVNIVNKTHSSNLTLPDVLNNTTATAIFINSTVTGVLINIPAGVGNNIDTTSPSNKTPSTAIYAQKESIVKVIVPSAVSFVGVALMLFIWWSSSRASFAGVAELPPIASLIADPTSSAVAPIVELVNRSTQNQPPPHQ